MSRGMRWTKEQMSARGWRDPDPPRYEGADTVGKLNAGFRQSYVPSGAGGSGYFWETVTGKPGGRCSGHGYWTKGTHCPKCVPVPLMYQRALKASAAALQPRQRTRQAKAGKPVPYERDVLRAVLAALKAHPRVAWAVRVNSGMAMMRNKRGKSRPVQFGFLGCSDIIGQMGKAGRVPTSDTRLGPDGTIFWAWPAGALLCVEVKRPGKKPTLAQAAFLLRVREAGGVGFVATDVADVYHHLGMYKSYAIDKPPRKG